MSCTKRACSHETKGDFYTEVETCITCRAPEEAAPDLLGFKDHCFFKKQPSTPEELDRAIRAMSASCISSLRYAGRDPGVLRRLEELGLRSLCDFPRPWWQRLLFWRKIGG